MLPHFGQVNSGETVFAPQEESIREEAREGENFPMVEKTVPSVNRKEKRKEGNGGKNNKNGSEGQDQEVELQAEPRVEKTQTRQEMDE